MGDLQQHTQQPQQPQPQVRAAAYTPPPPGSITPGTVLRVGATDVIVERFLAQGGFAYVYVVTISGLNSSAVLKRVVSSHNDTVVADLQNEITTMRLLRGHKNIVRIIDSAIGSLPSGAYEVLILMEYCTGGHLVDFLNTRLAQRLAEHEILKIFSDVCEGVAQMHSLSPPIIHRDLKIENVLIAGQEYKVCDFGSATRREIPSDSMTAKDIRTIGEEIRKHTTLQYRAPELCDLYQKRGISTKIDIWALGVLLYKLCYFCTPFEEQGTLAILNAQYTFPSYPVYSQALQNLIKGMLQVNIDARPDIFTLYADVCKLRRVPNNLAEMAAAYRRNMAVPSIVHSVYPTDISDANKHMGSLPQISKLSISEAPHGQSSSTNQSAFYQSPTLDAAVHKVRPIPPSYSSAGHSPANSPGPNSSFQYFNHVPTANTQPSTGDLPLRRGRLLRGNMHGRHQSMTNVIPTPAAGSQHLYPAYQAMLGNADKNRMSAPLHYMFNSDDTVSRLMNMTIQEKHHSTGTLDLSMHDIMRLGSSSNGTHDGSVATAPSGSVHASASSPPIVYQQQASPAPSSNSPQQPQQWTPAFQSQGLVVDTHLRATGGNPFGGLVQQSAIIPSSPLSANPAGGPVGGSSGGRTRIHSQGHFRNKSWASYSMSQASPQVQHAGGQSIQQMKYNLTAAALSSQPPVQQQMQQAALPPSQRMPYQSTLSSDGVLIAGTIPRSNSFTFSQQNPQTMTSDQLQQQQQQMQTIHGLSQQQKMIQMLQQNQQLNESHRLQQPPQAPQLVSSASNSPQPVLLHHVHQQQLLQQQQQQQQQQQLQQQQQQQQQQLQQQILQQQQQQEQQQQQQQKQPPVMPQPNAQQIATQSDDGRVGSRSSLELGGNDGAKHSTTSHGGSAGSSGVASIAAYGHRRNNSGLANDDNSAWEVQNISEQSQNSAYQPTQKQQSSIQQVSDPFEQFAAQRLNRTPSAVSAEVNSLSVNTTTTGTVGLVYSPANSLHPSIVSAGGSHQRTISQLSATSQHSEYLDAQSSILTHAQHQDSRSVGSYSSAVSPNMGGHYESETVSLISNTNSFIPKPKGNRSAASSIHSNARPESNGQGDLSQVNQIPLIELHNNVASDIFSDSNAVPKSAESTPTGMMSPPDLANMTHDIGNQQHHFQQHQMALSHQMDRHLRPMTSGATPAPLTKGSSITSTSTSSSGLSGSDAFTVSRPGTAGSSGHPFSGHAEFQDREYGFTADNNTSSWGKSHSFGHGGQLNVVDSRNPNMFEGRSKSGSSTTSMSSDASATQSSDTIALRAQMGKSRPVTSVPQQSSDLSIPERLAVLRQGVTDATLDGINELKRAGNAGKSLK